MELKCAKCGVVSRVDVGMYRAVGRFNCPSCRVPMVPVDGPPPPEEPPLPVPASAPEVTPASSDTGPWLSANLPAVDGEEIPMRFIGTGGDYFRIWIVNIALTLLTLGIYSAWAKVRRKHFFYGHTLLDGSGFQYLGDPRKILLGRLLLVLLLMLLGVASRYAPQATDVISNLLFIFLFPWLMIKARAFNLRNSAFRNLRFDFRGGYGRAFRVLILNPILALLTLGILMPYMQREQQAFWAERSCYGSAYGAFHGELRHMVRLFLHISVVGVLGVILWGVTLVLGQAYLRITPHPAVDLTWLNQVALPMTFLLIYAYYRAILFRWVWNHVGLGDGRFICRLHPGRMVWITLSNTIMILFSVGLLAPWAQVRTARYRLQSLSLKLGAGGLAAFMAARQEEVGAVGEEIGDFFDVDIGL